MVSEFERQMRGLILQYLAEVLDTHELDRRSGRLARNVTGQSVEARLLYGRTRSLLSELGYGHRSERSVRMVLRGLSRRW